MGFRLAATRRKGSVPMPLLLLLGLFSLTALVAVVMAIWKPEKHSWELPHSAANTFLANRPECPENWAEFPLWPDSIVSNYLRSRDLSPRYFAVSGGQIAYRPPNGQLPLSGPQTNIPEFNDCQKLLSISNPARFDSLAAIFVAIKVDSVTAGLGWHSVNWSSSNAAVATVSASGAVTGVAVGSATITAISANNPQLVKKIVIQVVPGPPSPAPLPPIHLSSSQNPQNSLLTVGSVRYAVAEFGEVTTSPRAVATIYNYGPGYPALGIGPNFNCLYLYFDTEHTLRARMIPMDIFASAASVCTDPVLEARSGKELAVRRIVVNIQGASQTTLYPPVARWDWDGTSQKQFIGLACGNAWCEIGEAPFNPPTSTPVATSMSAPEQRVLHVKGWHDQQILAIVREPGGDPVPSNLLGTVIPNPELKTQPWSMSGPAEWHLAAYVTLQDLNGSANTDLATYKAKLNMDEVPAGTPLEKTNKLFYCYGPRKACVPDTDLLQKECESWFEKFFMTLHRWWVRIDGADGSSRVFCLTRRSHPGYNFDIAPTARWRWILSDDSIWTECVNGCCQTGEA